MTKSLVVLSGGVGGAKFAQGVERFVADAMSDSSGLAEVSIIVNTADDFWLSGLRICPDLDSVMYALGGVNDEEQGWGRATETFRVQEELNSIGVGWPWFALGDLDLATHIARTGWLAEGLSLLEVTDRLCKRLGIQSRILPMSNDSIETYVHFADNSAPMHLEEWWVRFHAEREASRFEFRGADMAEAEAETLKVIANADVIFLAPSNPIVSISPILAVSQIQQALLSTKAQIVGVSPIIAGEPVRGMAQQCLRAASVECSARGVAEYYGARSAGGILDGWLLANEDADDLQALRDQGISCAATNLWMRNPEVTAEMVAQALRLVKR
jgi:LPPG:FO 2-phospho-L-lactate transferase